MAMYSSSAGWQCDGLAMPCALQRSSANAWLVHELGYKMGANAWLATCNPAHYACMQVCGGLKLHKVLAQAAGRPWPCSARFFLQPKQKLIQALEPQDEQVGLV